MSPLLKTQLAYLVAQVISGQIDHPLILARELDKLAAVAWEDAVPQILDAEVID